MRRAAAVLALAAAAALRAPAPAAGAAGVPCQASLRPGAARVGQPVVYRGRVVAAKDEQVRWERPVSAGALEWGPARTRRIVAYAGSRSRRGEPWLADTLELEAELRAFTPGWVSVPGLGFELRDAAGRARVGRLPVVRLAVVPVVPAQDTSARLRPLRGPFGAPWWERVPWLLVAGGALALVAAGVLVRRSRRRRPAPAAASVPALARPPGDVALAALAALRERRLPEAGRYAEHALELTAILRRFLEAGGGAVRPGDSTPELVRHLGTEPLPAAEVARLGELLAAWDRVKFARAASDPEEARSAEAAVEEHVRRRAGSAGGTA